MVEYGLLASRASDFLGDFFWQMKVFLGAMPLWQMIVAGVLLVGVRVDLVDDDAAGDVGGSGGRGGFSVRACTILGAGLLP